MKKRVKRNSLKYLIIRVLNELEEGLPLLVGMTGIIILFYIAGMMTRGI